MSVFSAFEAVSGNKTIVFVHQLQWWIKQDDNQWRIIFLCCYCQNHKFQFAYNKHVAAKSLSCGLKHVLEMKLEKECFFGENCSFFVDEAKRGHDIALVND